MSKLDDLVKKIKKDREDGGTVKTSTVKTEPNPVRSVQQKTDMTRLTGQSDLFTPKSDSFLDQSRAKRIETAVKEADAQVSLLAKTRAPEPKKLGWGDIFGSFAMSGDSTTPLSNASNVGNFLSRNPDLVEKERENAEKYAAERAKSVDEVKKFAKDHSVVSSLASIPTSLLSVADWLARRVETSATGAPLPRKDLLPGEYSRTVRSAVSEDMSRPGAFLYNVAMSGADSYAAALSAGGLLLSFGAATAAEDDVLAKGGSQEQALMAGLAAGTFEALFEEFSISQLRAMREVPVTGAKDVLTNIVKSGDKSFNKVISEAVQNFMGSAAGQVLKTAAVVVSGVWSAATGALDAANLFMVSDDDVDIGMRTVSAIMNLLVDFIPVAGPVFDFLSTISEMLGFPNFKRELAEKVYNLLFSITGGNSRGVQTLDQKQQEFEKEYEAYLKDHNLSKEDLSIAEYNDIVNQTVGDKIVNTVSGAARSVGNWISGLFGGNKDKEKEETSQGNGPGSEKTNPTAEIKRYNENLKNNQEAATKKSEKFNSLGYGGGALGYGPGGLKQDDPSYASLSLGTLPDGSPANMANSGCGPTALANAVNAAGGNANPGEVGRYARRNGMLTDGGANAKLFTEGARKYGMSGTEISGMDSLDASLDNGNPVIVSGKSMGYGSGCNSCDSLYTKAGHIVTVTGRTPDGMYTVDDGEGSSVVSPGMLQNGATHAYSMERLGGAITRGTSVSDGTAVRASNTGTQANVMQDNGTTIQHGSYYFAQNDPTWGGNTLSGYSSNIKNTGCVMTSAAMGASTVLGKPIDPGTFNAQYGNGNVGSTSFNNLGLKVTRLPAGGRQAIVSPSGDILPQVVQALKQRKMVMMYGDKSATNMYNDGNPNGSAHCVLATGLDSAGNILINNPWSTDGKYGQVRSAQVAYPAVPSSVDPFHWAQIIETTDGRGASTTLDPSAVSGVAAGSTAGSTASGTTAGAAGTTGTAADGTATGTDSTSGSSGNVLEAIFGAMGNIVNTVGGRLMKSVFSGKSYDEVKAEEEAQEAQTAATDTDATSLGSGPASANLTPKEQAEALKARGKQTDAILKKKLSKAQLEKINFGPTEDIGHGPAMGDETSTSNTMDYQEQVIMLLTDIRENTGKMTTGGALGGTTKKMETGKNTNAAKEGKKSDTQRKQRAKDSAKQKLSTLNNGLNSDSLGRGNLRSTYAKIASY